MMPEPLPVDSHRRKTDLPTALMDESERKRLSLDEAERRQLALDAARNAKLKIAFAAFIVLSVTEVVAIVAVTFLMRDSPSLVGVLTTIVGIFTPFQAMLGAAIVKLMCEHIVTARDDLVIAHRAVAREAGRRDKRTPWPGQHPTLNHDHENGEPHTS